VEALEILERHLSGRTWMCEDHQTIADLAVYGYTHVSEEGGFDLAPFPAVRDWQARVATDPAHFPITFAPD
jgi:glutathione S-transferase